MNEIKSLLIILFLPLFLLPQTPGSKLDKFQKRENTAVIAKEKNGEWWQKRHIRKLEEIKRDKRDAQIVFIGNSITHGLEKPGNKDLREKFFGKYNPHNLGVGADRTENGVGELSFGHLGKNGISMINQDMKYFEIAGEDKVFHTLLFLKLARGDTYGN